LYGNVIIAFKVLVIPYTTDGNAIAVTITTTSSTCAFILLIKAILLQGLSLVSF
jgi:hypothetical protein